VQSQLGSNWPNFLLWDLTKHHPNDWGPLLQVLYARLLDLGNLIGWKRETSIDYEPSFRSKT